MHIAKNVFASPLLLTMSFVPSVCRRHRGRETVQGERQVVQHLGHEARAEDGLQCEQRALRAGLQRRPGERDGQRECRHQDRTASGRSCTSGPPVFPALLGRRLP